MAVDALVLAHKEWKKDPICTASEPCMLQADLPCLHATNSQSPPPPNLWACHHSCLCRGWITIMRPQFDMESHGQWEGARQIQLTQGEAIRIHEGERVVFLVKCDVHRSCTLPRSSRAALPPRHDLQMLSIPRLLMLQRALSTPRSAVQGSMEDNKRLRTVQYCCMHRGCLLQVTFLKKGFALKRVHEPRGLALS